MRILAIAGRPAAAISAVVLTATAFVALPASAADGQKVALSSDINLFGASPEVLALMATQQKIDENADRIEAASRDTLTSGLSGITVDARHNSLHLYWHGNLSASVAEIIDEIRAKGGTVIVKPAPYTLTQLIAERDRLTSVHMDKNVLTDPQVVTIGPKSDGSGLKVGVSGVPKNLAAEHIRQLVPTVQSSVDLDFVSSPVPLPTTRFDDAPLPHWGGAYIEQWDFDHREFMGSCTSGFAVEASILVYTMLTAAHCGTDAWWFTGDNSDRYRSGNNNRRNDAMLLNQGGTNASVRNVGAIWAGGSIMGERPQGGVRVARAQTSRNGDLICTSGAFSGSFCNMQVEATRETINMRNFGTVTEAILAHQLNHIGATGNGDSGGPVFSVDQDGRIAARGTLSAMPDDQDLWVDCQGVPAGPRDDPRARHCSFFFWYPDILFQMGGMGGNVTIRTLP